MRCTLLLGLLLTLVTGCARHQQSAQQHVEGDASASISGASVAMASAPVAVAQRIVTLTPGLTELVYAVGGEASLVATVEYADYPEAAKAVPRIGNAFRVDLERLLSFQPDLVLVWTSGTSAATVAQIKALGLNVVSVDALRLGDVATALRLVGQLTGHREQAERAALAFTEGVERLRVQYANAARLTTFIEVSRQPLYTVNGQHVLSEVVSLCGGDNVFANLNQLAPSVSEESVLQRAPQVILATDGSTAELRNDWQAWPQLPASAQQHIYAVSPDITTRATPRLLQGAEAVCAVMQQARR